MHCLLNVTTIKKKCVVCCRRHPEAPHYCAAVASDMETVQEMTLRLIGTNFAQTPRSPILHKLQISSHLSRE